MKTKRFQVGLALVLGLVMAGAMSADTVIAAVRPKEKPPVVRVKPGYHTPGYWLSNSR